MLLPKLLIVCSLAISLSFHVIDAKNVFHRRLAGDAVVSPPHVYKKTDFESFATSRGFQIRGTSFGDESSHSLAIGDFNGDGYDDIIIGASNEAVNEKKFAGISYVLFGKGVGPFVDIDLAVLFTNSSSPQEGFKIFGAAEFDFSGTSVANAGDMNGDGIDDMIIVAPLAGQPGSDNIGVVYVIFGKSSSSSIGFADIDLSTLTKSQGIQIFTADSSDNLGSISGIGDFNGDGYDDIAIGTPRADSLDRVDAGAAYIIFGKTDIGAANIDLAVLTESTGYQISGVTAGDMTGSTVANIGDINGDGYDDVAIGAVNNTSVSYYILFGRVNGFTNLDLANLTSSEGFKIFGASDAAGDRPLHCQVGFTINAAGDFNGDGFDDVVIGTVGISYLIFGKERNRFADIDLSALTNSQGLQMFSATSDDQSSFSVTSASDLNGDGYDDLMIIGSQKTHPEGIVYVIYGTTSTDDIDFADLSLTATKQGFQLMGVTNNDSNNDDFGSANVADINGDGYLDIIIGTTPKKTVSEASCVVASVFFGAAPQQEGVRKMMI